jgi:hypothetical protein
MRSILIKYSLALIILICSNLFGQKPEWVIYDTSNSQIRSNNIYDIAIDKFNRKWILNDSGLVKIDGDNWSLFRTTPRGYDLRLARVLKTDNDGNLWIGGGMYSNSGILKFDGNTWTSYDTSNSSLPSNYIRSIMFDSENTMWIFCGDYGPYSLYLVKFKKESEWTIFNGNFCRYTSGEIAAIDDNDNIWSADEWHLYKFKDSIYTTINPAEGLGQYITDMKFDNSHNLWIASGHAGWGGLTRFDGTNYFYYYYYAISLDVDANNLWVGTENFDNIDSSGTLLLYNGTTWKVFTHENSPLPKNMDVIALKNDLYGNLWIGLLPKGPSGDHRIGGGVAVYKNGGVITPVELLSFTASANNKDIILTWQTATEVNNKGFEIQRKSSTSNYSTVSFVSGHGTTTSTNNYSWSEKLLSGYYSYRLKQLDFDGKFEYSKEAEVTITPQTFILGQNYPNPFNPTTEISYSLHTATNVKLIVFNTLGQTIKTLVSEYKNPGKYSVNFNASALPSGIYFYRLEMENQSIVKKMILLK